MQSMRKRILFFGAVVIVLLGMVVLSRARSQKPTVTTTQEIQAEEGIPVQLATVVRGDVDDSVEVTGSISALSTVTLSSKVAGKIQDVSVREGDPVTKGMTVVQLDQSDAQSAMQQAQAAYQTSLARLSQARTAYEVQLSQSSASIQQARAALDQAQAKLAVVKNGARTQERIIAENQVAQAKANYDNAASNLKRMKSLYSQGAIPALQLDQYQTQYDVARATYNSAKQQLSLIQEGSRSEDIRAAEAQVAQAKEALNMAEANAGQNALKREDIKSAQAGVKTGEAGVRLAQQQIANNIIVSPINGIVSKRMTEPGQTTGAGNPLLEVVDLNTVYFEANVSEIQLASIVKGQPVEVRVDAFPDKTFAGTVSRIMPSGSTTSRSFVVRVNIPNPNGELKPAMFARGGIVTGVHKGVVLVPSDAVDARQGSFIVFTVEKNNYAKKHVIQKGLENKDYVEVVEPTTLRPGDRVVTVGKASIDNDDAKVYLAGAGDVKNLKAQEQ